MRPSALELKEDALYGLCWQTKVDRKRRGTKFAIAPVGLIREDELRPDGFAFTPWLLMWWDLFQVHAAGDRDFWMFELDGMDQFGPGVCSYLHGLKSMKGVLASAVKFANCSPDRRMELAHIFDKLTWHSCRVTILNAAVHAGVDALPISMQANHANTDLVVKYTRDRRQVPLKMLTQLCSDLRRQWTPVAPLGDQQDYFSADEDDEGCDLAPVFYIKKASASSRRIDHAKIHVTAQDDLSLTACNLVKLADCDPLGCDLPDVSVLCNNCKRRRADLWPVNIE